MGRRRFRAGHRLPTVRQRERRLEQDVGCGELVQQQRVHYPPHPFDWAQESPRPLHDQLLLLQLQRQDQQPTGLRHSAAA